MKTIIPFTIAAALAASGVSQAQGTPTPAFSKPSGYVTLGNTTGAQGTPSVAANTDVVIASPLLRATEFAGSVSSVSGSTSIEVSGTQNWASDKFTSDPAKPYLVYAASGSQEGLSALITGSAGSVLTVSAIEGDVTALAQNDLLQIIPAWTMKSFIAPSSVPPGTQVFAYSGTVPGINIPPSQIMTSTGAAWVFTFGASGSADNFIVYPTECLVLRTGPNPVQSIVITGTVPTFKHRLTLSKLSAPGTAQDIRLAYTSPVGQGLLASQLGSTAGDQLFIYNNSASGRNKAPSQIMTYTGSAWVGTFGPLTGNQNLFELKGGEGYVFRAAASGAVGSRDWVSEQSYKSSL